MASLAAEEEAVQEDPAYGVYKKYLWKDLAANHADSGRVLRTIYCQFGSIRIVFKRGFHSEMKLNLKYGIAEGLT